MCRPVFTASKSRRSTPTSTGRRSRSSECGCCRALEAVAVDAGAGSFDSMRTLAPPTARGWEAVVDDGIWDWSDELAELPSLLTEKVKAPSVTPGPTDLVIDPSNLWLTIHESIGHATEYDRAIGYEAAYAGTSFATPDLLGKLRYGSPVMNVTADRTVDFGLATVGYDDEGVAAQSWDLVRRRHVRRLPTRPGVRAAAGREAVQRLLVRRLAAPRADSADGQRVAAAGTRGHLDRRT